MNQMMTYEELQISPFEFLTIEKLEIHKEINEHSNLELFGKVKAELAEPYLERCDPETEICIKFRTGSILFHGMINHINLKKEGGIYSISVQAVSKTFLMDIEKKKRSFQDIAATYADIIKGITGEYKDSNVIVSNEFDVPTGQLLLQYDETDWQFIKRLASHKNQGLYPYVEAGFLAYHAGTPSIERNAEIAKTDYEIERELGEFQKAEKNTIQNITSLDFSAYRIESLKVMELGEQVMFRGIPFYVKKAEIRMQQAGLAGYYDLSTKNGLQKELSFNEQLRGSSIKGTVIAVQRDQIKVHIHEADKEQSIEKAYWFSYSSIYASQDGSGWYCMPEVGDEVRIQIPDIDEKSAFAVSAVSNYQPSKGQADRMADYQRRYIRNPQGMEIMWTPQQVIISANGGSKLVLDESGTIYVQSKTNISIAAGESIELSAGDQVSIQASDSIKVRCGGKAEISMDKEGKTELKGNKVYIN